MMASGSVWVLDSFKLFNSAVALVSLISSAEIVASLVFVEL